MYVVIMDYRKDTPRELGRVRMVNGDIHLESEDPLVARDLENHQREVAGRNWTDEEFLKSLELLYSGAYIRAGFIAEG